MTPEVVSLIQACAWAPSQFLMFSDNVFAKLIYYSHLGSIIPVILIAAFVFIYGRKELASILLVITTIFFSFWVFGDLVLWANEYPSYIMFFWALINICEPFVYFFAFYFFCAYVSKKDFSILQKIIFALPLIPTLVFAPTKLMLLGYDISNCDRAAVEGVLASYGYAIEILYTLLIIGFAVYAWKKAEDAITRRRTILLTIGIVLFLLSFSIGNIIEVFSLDWGVGQYGLFGAPVFVAFLAYLIVRYKAFNVRLIGAQALMAGIWLSMLSLLFIRTINDVRIIVSITLIFVLIAAIWLVRGVYREIQLSEQLSEFMSLATHEIRNPATYIRGSAMGALDGDLGELTPPIKDTMQKIFIRVNDIIHLGNQYMDKSKLELNKITYEFVPTDLAKLTGDLIHEFEPAAAQRGITITSNIDKNQSYEVQADSGKIKEVIGNLIDNAIKYTKEGNGGSVAVSVVKGEGIVTTKIVDTGDGIPAKTIPELFKKFSRADAQKANLLGTGLGLYLAKIFIDAHNGKIWVESPGKDKGSTFFVELPITHVSKR